MKRFFLILTIVFTNMAIINGQNISEDVSIQKLNAQANVLAKRFCDVIVKVGTSTASNGLSYAQKKKIIGDVGRDFYNYYEDPRIMTTTGKSGKPRKKPISSYLNNLLSQSNSNNLQIRKYEIRCNKFVIGGNGTGWKYERKLSDGCEVYYREFTFEQTYRVIDIFNKNPELRNTEHVEIDKKTMRIYAIIKPGNNQVVVRLGDILRSECKDGR